jgi:protein phosphatase
VEAQLVIRASGVSDVGRVRKTNEDKYVTDFDLGLFAVADGMGGHKAGEVAAQLAIETVAGFISRSANDDDVTWPYGIDETVSYEGNRFRTAILLANRKIVRVADSSDDYGGMGTTIAGVLLTGSRAVIGSVGDSRVYLLTGGRLDQLTVDDSWAETILAQDPKLGPEEIANHPMRNVLTNVLGGRPTVEVHMSERVLSAGDVLLLCSDGLHGVLAREVLEETLANTPDAERAARTLVEMALDAGSRDNVTALVVRVEEDR